MKNKYLYIICACLFVITVSIIVFLNMNKKEDNPPIETEYKMHKDFIKLDVEYREEKIESQVLKSYEEYTSLFDNDSIKENDFASNNYLLLVVDYMGCSEEDILPTDYKIDGNKIKVDIKYRRRCGLCAPDQKYFLLKVDKNVIDMEVEINSEAVNTVDCPSDVVFKPLIYLYPEKKMNIIVKLGNPNSLLVTYPKYNNEWNVTAYPSGKLIDNKTNRELYGLYWEGNNYPGEFTNEGFVVKGEDTIKFLEEKLEILGLNEREADEFIIYWLPKLEESEYNYIRFESLEEINNYMPLEIMPKPDTIIRVYMEYMPLDKYVNVKEQKLVTPKREGFSVVEWGGSKITY